MKTKFNYNQFDIGDWVKVKKQVYVINGEGKRRRIDCPKHTTPKVGRITGVKCLREGTIHVEPFDDEFIRGVEHIFQHSNTITCWEIRTGLMNKPIFALPEDIEICSIEETKNLEFPVLNGSFEYSWDKQSKEEMRKKMADWPRDSKGRWTGGTKE